MNSIRSTVSYKRLSSISISPSPTSVSPPSPSLSLSLSLSLRKRESLVGFFYLFPISYGFSNMIDACIVDPAVDLM
ncbi:unnamed protein product [Prunus armeniaca]